MSNHLPQKIQNAPSATSWNIVDLCKLWLESWQRLGVHGGKSCCHETQKRNLTRNKRMSAEDSVKGNTTDALLILA